MTAMTLTAENDAAIELQSSTGVALEVANGENRSFAPRGLKAAFGALDTCEAELMKRWGYDPHERDSMKIAPKRVAMENWFSPDDYPAAALAKGLGGVTIALYLVGIDGKVTDCRTVSSSGTKSLDDAACRAITKRARYVPAIGLDDKPIAMHQTHRAVWRVPQ